MVWGAISSRGNTELQVIKVTINSKKYQKMLTKAQPSIKQLFPKGFVFQLHGALCHTSKFTTTWFQRSKWLVSDWPPNSPNLNPIDNV
jgi:hypothetical protein